MLTGAPQSVPSVGIGRRLLLTAILAGLAGLSVWLDQGRVSLAQQAWLAWTRAAWLVAPVFLALDPRIGRPARIVLGGFAACMWLRVPLEAAIASASAGWQTATDVGHEALAIGVTLGLVLWQREELGRDERPLDPWARAAIAGLLASLLIEIAYALALYEDLGATIDTAAALLDVPLYAAGIALLARWLADETETRLPGGPAHRPRAPRALTLSARQPVASLCLLAVLTAGLGAAALGARPRYEIEDFFPEGTPERASFERVGALFGRDDRTAVLILESEGPIGIAQMRTIQAVTRRLGERPELEEVLSPSSAHIVVRRADDRLWLERAIPPEGPTAERMASVLATYRSPPYVDAILSADQRVAVIAATLRGDRMGFEDRRTLRDAMEVEAETMREAGFLSARVAGYPIQRVELQEMVRRESGRLFPFVIAVILIVLALAFRDPVLVALPLAVSVLAAVWTLGAMTAAGLPPTVVTSAVFVMVVVVGVGDSVHLLTRTRELRLAGRSARSALSETLDEIGIPLLLTSVTTAVVFASQVLTGIPLIVGFGVQTAIGVSAAFCVTLLLIPPLLALDVGRGVAATAGASAPPGAAGRLVRASLAIDRAVARRPVAVLLGCLLALGLAVAGALRVRVNSPFLADLAEEHPIRETSRFVERRLGGVIPIDVLIEPPAETATDPMAPYRKAHIDRVAALTDRLRADPDVLGATSVVDTLRQMVRLLEKVEPSEATGMLPTALLLAQDQVARWVNDRHDVMRVRLRVRDVDTDAAFALFERIERAYEEEMGVPAQGRITGQGYLGQLVNRRMVSHFGTGFAVAILAVLAIVGLSFGSVRVALVTLLPNLFPVAAVAATMWLLGIELRYTSALVLSVVFGLAVDDTIHFVSQLRAEREADDPIRETFATAGPGLLLTSIVLAAGFSVMVWSEFLPNRVLGVLLALTAVFALVGDLLMLPALLRVTGVGRS